MAPRTDKYTDKAVEMVRADCTVLMPSAPSLCFVSALLTEPCTARARSASLQTALLDRICRSSEGMIEVALLWIEVATPDH